MLWMITVTVTGFLLGEPAFSMNGYYGHKFISAAACDSYARSGEMEDEEIRLRRMAQAHLKRSDHADCGRVYVRCGDGRGASLNDRYIRAPEDR